jgi:hypothetical protein
MPDHAETLKSMLQSIINDRHEEASVTMHDYFVSKTKEVSGLGGPQSVPTDFDETDPDEIDAE